MTPHPDCPSTRRHNTLNAHASDRCRCPAARAAHTRYSKRRLLDVAAGRPRTIPADGCRRRIQALLAIGWTGSFIAAELGVSRARLSYLTSRQEAVTPRTAAAVSALYDRLSSQPGPSAMTRGHAAAAGYVPPIGWDDDAIDDPGALPWVERTETGRTVNRARRCTRPGCQGFALGRAQLCSPRCRRLAAAHRREWDAARKRPAA
jgi:hypothetical protein